MNNWLSLEKHSAVDLTNRQFTSTVQTIQELLFNKLVTIISPSVSLCIRSSPNSHFNTEIVKYSEYPYYKVAHINSLDNNIHGNFFPISAIKMEINLQIEFVLYKFLSKDIICCQDAH